MGIKVYYVFFCQRWQNRTNGHFSKWPPWNLIKSYISGTDCPIGLSSTPKHTKSMTMFLVESFPTIKNHDVIIKIQNGRHKGLKSYISGTDCPIGLISTLKHTKSMSHIYNQILSHFWYIQDYMAWEFCTWNSS